jgi:S1-C subfamily serine protease
MRLWIFASVLSGLIAAPFAAVAEPAKIKEVVAKAPISVADKPNVKSAIFKRSQVTMLTSEKLGEYQVGWFCIAQNQLSMTPKFIEAVRPIMARAFRAEMTKAGYPKPPQAESVFESAAKQAADFDVGASLRDMKMNLCKKSNDLQGGAYVEIKWEVFSPRAQKVAFELTTEGSFQNGTAENITVDDIIERAMAAAARNLLADPKFVEIMTGAGEEVAAATATEFSIKGGRALDGGVARNTTLLRAAVATIDSGFGTGSGFFISPDGHLLTNQHVVGDVKFVKVKLVTNRELVGEVLKADKTRDIALIKTEAIAVQPLPIRSSELNIGEEVFAVGSPLGDTFNTSLTKGILSGYRTLNDLRYLQSDVAILPGSSGGPLLDGAGAVIGITVRALDSGRANLNLFVPIQEALNKFAIVFHE